MEITIDNKQYKLKYTLRAMFIFEQITNKMFEMKTLTDEYIFFYCLLLANNEDMDLTFEQLIDVLDEQPSIMKEYQNFMHIELEKQKQFIKDAEDSDGKKKL